MRIARRLVAAGLLLTVAGAGGVSASQVQAAQPDEVAGLQFVADNAATAASAALVPSALGRLDGTAGQSVSLPGGFSIAQVVTGLRSPRFMTFDDAGNLLVADMAAGAIYRYPSVAGTLTPSAQPPSALVSGLEAPSNVSLYDGYLYIGETSTVSRYAYEASGPVGAREPFVTNLPRGGHSTRTTVFGPDGVLYVSVGSSCNICDESDPRRASILRFSNLSDGSAYDRFAGGLRNAVGLAIQPSTGVLWATVNERDNQGNEIPPDLVTVVRQGQNFGWPGCQPPNATPQDAGRDCSGITPPSIGIQAHSAPLGLAFYNGQHFPSEYAGDLFVVQHGSWNRQPPAQPKLLRIHFEGDRPVSAQDFATGWQTADGSRWGRPAGVIAAPDGSLIVSDDQSGVLYRVVYSAS
jgi:glucose/arabinose dehydrogenase